jgi:hypothetical protein
LGLKLPAKLSVIDASPLGIEVGEATIRRDDGLMLVLEAEGKGEGPNTDKHEAGRAPPPRSVVFERPNGSRIVGTEVAPLRWKTRHVQDANASDGVTPITSVRSYVNLLDCEEKAGEAAKIIEWVAQAPTWNMWPRATEREETRAVVRRRDEEKVVTDRERRKSFGRDHLLVELDLATLRSIRFGRVDGILAGETDPVPNPGFIEYTVGDAGVPDDKLRASVRAALGFLFGAGLNIVGRTHLDAQHDVLRYRLMSSAAGDTDERPPAILDECYRSRYLTRSAHAC